MKAVLLFLVLPLTIVLALIGFSYKSTGGKAGYTGSPGETTCANCHNSFALNSGNGQLLLSIAGTQTMDGVFYTDSTYLLNVTIKQPGASLFGFGLEALNNQGKNAGVLKITQPQKTQMMNANVGGNSRTNVVHKKDAGLAADSMTFSMEWTAPDAASDVTFYLAGNGANANDKNTGDYIYSISKNVSIIEFSGTNTINIADILELSVYPNPAYNFVTIQVPGTQVNYIFQIFSVTGQLVASELTNSFSIADYQKGSYWVRAYSTDEKKVFQTRFIKL